MTCQTVSLVVSDGGGWRNPEVCSKYLCKIRCSLVPSDCTDYLLLSHLAGVEQFSQMSFAECLNYIHLQHQKCKIGRDKLKTKYIEISKILKDLNK
jgi:hypothetical protein